MEKIKINRKLWDLLANGVVLTLLFSSSACQIKDQEQNDSCYVSSKEQESWALDEVNLVLFNNGINIITPQDYEYYEDKEVIKSYSMAFLLEHFPSLPIDGNELTNDELVKIWNYFHFDYYSDSELDKEFNFNEYTDINTNLNLCYSKDGYYFTSEENQNTPNGNLLELFGPKLEDFIVEQVTQDEFGNKILKHYINNFDLYLFETDMLNMKNRDFDIKNLVKTRYN